MTDTIKIGIGYIYCLLVSVFILSSCILFMLVAAENSAILGDENPFNVSIEQILESENVNRRHQKDFVIPEIQTIAEMKYFRSSFSSKTNLKLEPNLDEVHSSFDEFTTLSEQDNAVFSLSSSSDKLAESQKAPAPFTLGELSVDVDGSSFQPLGPSVEPALTNDNASFAAKSDYIVKAEPKVIEKLQDTMAHGPMTMDAMENNRSVETNDSVIPLAPAPPQHPVTPPPALTTDSHDDIPSFNEWTQKQLEQDEKKGDNLTIGQSALKVRSKNYASVDCGGKVVAANPEAISPGAVLSPSRDEYLLNACNNRIWFIVELCEPIQPLKNKIDIPPKHFNNKCLQLELANFELFSSSPRHFSVWASDRYPSREWVFAGEFTAQDERTVQSFPIHSSPTLLFAKFIKVELHSHYGAEHYCPISLCRIYGTSEFEVLDTVEEIASRGLSSSDDSDDDDEDEEKLSDGRGGGEQQNYLFGSARDAVLSIVKKAAEVLVTTPADVDPALLSPQQAMMLDNLTMSSLCITPSHSINCHNCSQQHFYRVYHAVSCHSSDLSQLLESWFVRDLAIGVCPQLLHCCENTSALNYLQALLPTHYLTALCNVLSVLDSTAVLNASYNQARTTEEVRGNTEDEHPMQTHTPELSVMTTDSQTASSAATQIRPTKTLAKEGIPSVNMTSEKEGNATDDVQLNTAETQPLPTDTLTEKDMQQGTEATLNIPAKSEQSPVDPVPEEVLPDPISLDTLFSELENVVVDTRNPPKVAATVSPPHQTQKESVFVRLANRIKALERNMSLSSQYLEELSRRYKRQVEDMQRSLVEAFEEIKRSEAREAQHALQVATLTQRLDSLGDSVAGLLSERHGWHNKVGVLGQHGMLIVVEVLVFAGVLWLCRWLGEGRSQRWVPIKGQIRKRRTSADPTASQAPSARKRRPSEQALRIAGSTHQNLLIEDGSGKNRRRRRKRKELLLVKSSSSATLEGSGVVLAPEPTQRTSLDNGLNWWAEPRPGTAPQAPPFLKTALSARIQRAQAMLTNAATDPGHQRVSPAPSDSSSVAPSEKPTKKAGPFRRMVRKFF